jgi:hypothetical protein
LELVIGRLVRRRHFGHKRAQIKVEAAVEGALGGIAVHGGQHDAGDEENHHHPGGRGQEQPRGKRTAAHQGIILKDIPSGCDPVDGWRSSETVMRQPEHRARWLINTADQVPGDGGVNR